MAMSTVITSNKNLTMCSFNTDLFIQTAGTERMVVEDGLRCLMLPHRFLKHLRVIAYYVLSCVMNDYGGMPKWYRGH